MNATEPKDDRAARRGRIASLLEKLNLRFPGLFVLLAAIFLADLVVPDFIPFVDEIVLALLTTMFGLWKKQREERSPDPPVKEIPGKDDR